MKLYGFFFYLIKRFPEPDVMSVHTLCVYTDIKLKGNKSFEEKWCMHPEIHFIAAAKKARKLLNVESHQFQLLDRVFKLSIDLQTLSENSIILVM